MAVERVIHCDGPDCECHVQTASPPPYIPGFFLEVKQNGDNGDHTWHFCSWDCAMKFAAAQEPTITISLDDLEDDDA
jgi:hypothetical protein